MRYGLPDHIPPNHCLVTKQYAVYTPPIHDMLQQIGDWIDQQRPGGYIYGASRLGKTRGVQWYLTDVLEERFKVVLPLVVWSRRPDSQTSEKDFWNQLLIASHFQFVDPSKPLTKAVAIHLCKERFISIAKNAQRNYVLLLIDEAQGVTFKEWNWLLGLQNQLDYDGYLLSVFSIGSHQLGFQHEYLAATCNAHIAARFMAASAQFHGLRSEAELEYVLNAYDIDSEWPPDSKISFLEYFAPVDYADGRRLCQCAPEFWRALVALAPKSVRLLEFPMQHVATAIESTLFQLASGGHWDEVTRYENWLDNLARANFSDHMRIIST